MLTFLISYFIARCICYSQNLHVIWYWLFITVLKIYLILSGFKQKRHLGHTMSGGQVSRSSIAGWFWVGVSHEIAAKLLAGDAVI